MVRTFKTRVYPDAQQRVYLHKMFGIRRWTWNFGLAHYFEQVKEQKYPDGNAIQKYINNNVVGALGYEWLDEVNTMVRSESLKDLSLALQAWRQLQAQERRSTESLDSSKGKPKFKKKGKGVESARLFHKNDSVFKIESRHVFSCTTVRGTPRLQLQTRESLEFLQTPVVNIKTCTFSLNAGCYYISLTYEKTNQTPRPAGSGTVGIDIGIKHVAACWDGTNGRIVDLPSAVRLAERHREKLQRQLSRKVYGSHRYNLLKLQLQRAYARESNIKRDFREKFTTELVENYNAIKIDDFSFKAAMNLKNSHRALYRIGCYAFKERLLAKANERGVQVSFVKAFTPTTKTCSKCGCIQNVDLKQRVYTCPHCGNKVDRDLNAAMNVYNICSK